MPEIWGKKHLFFDVLVGDCFASIVVYMYVATKRQNHFNLSLFRFKSSHFVATGETNQFLHLSMKINDENYSAKGRFPTL